jgi:hypothetical protein
MKLGFPVTTNFWVCGEEKDSRGFQVKDFCVCSDTTDFWALNGLGVCRMRRRRILFAKKEEEGEGRRVGTSVCRKKRTLCFYFMFDKFNLLDFLTALGSILS